MREYYELLKKMEARPAMWTGEGTLKSIWIFLSGYSCALADHELSKTKENDIDFYDWVAKKLGFNESTAGWHNMILAATLGLNPKSIRWKDIDAGVTIEQHKRSIQMFYELLEEYVTE